MGAWWGERCRKKFGKNWTLRVQEAAANDPHGIEQKITYDEIPQPFLHKMSFHFVCFEREMKANNQFEKGVQKVGRRDVDLFPFTTKISSSLTVWQVSLPTRNRKWWKEKK